ncbi:MAG: TauD/TfdA family dioxygenase [Planctomycetaceae bacterium]
MDGPNLRVERVTIANQQLHDGLEFPLVLKCESPSPDVAQVRHWIASKRDTILQLLQTHGVVLFRGFPLPEIEQFDQFVATFGLTNFPYEQSLSNAVRINYTPRVFSANEAPSEVTIFLHHEMAQTPVFPSKLFFYCQKPAEEGGATPVCRSDVLWQQMMERCPLFAKACEAKGLQYTNIMPSENDAASGMGRSWQGTFRASTRDDAELRMQRLGYSWEWLPDGCLRATTPVLPAVKEISAGRKVFFNQLIAAFRGWKDARNDPSHAITFGDRSILNRDDVLLVADMAEALTFDVPWQQGDVALVDNFIAMHGRRTFKGTRKVYASLIACDDAV